jgi:hypothetical protein
MLGLTLEADPKRLRVELREGKHLSGDLEHRGLGAERKRLLGSGKRETVIAKLCGIHRPNDDWSISSAVNDATRITGARLGVAVIGSIYTSLYASRLADDLPSQVPEQVAGSAERSVGTAFGISGELEASGQSGLAASLHDAASAAFFRGFETAVFVAAGIAVAGAVMAAIFIPSQPARVSAGSPSPSAVGKT